MMMARDIAALLAAAAALAAGGATVPQNSATNYFFTWPDRPGQIKGKVMGDPPAYGVMRSEDVSWIKEAYAERNAMPYGWRSTRRLDIPEFGRWPMSETNGYAKWTTAVFLESGALVTNIVARYRSTTNELAELLPRIDGRRLPEPPAASSMDLWLSLDDDDYAADMNYISVQSFPYVTNVTTVVTTNWPSYWIDDQWIKHGNTRTNESYITMAMTNGTTSVHTNRWTETLPHEERTELTNVVQLTWLDLVFKSNRVVHPAYPAGYVVANNAQTPRNMGGPFRAATILQWYKVLRQMKRLSAGFLSFSTTNRIYRKIVDWGDYYGPDPVTTVHTNYRGGVLFGNKTVNQRKWSLLDDEKVEGRMSVNVPLGPVKYETLFGSATNVLAGGHNRIKSLTAYAAVSCDANIYPNDSDPEELHSLCVKRLGAATLEGQADGQMKFSLTVDAESVIDAAMSTVGGMPGVGSGPGFYGRAYYNGSIVGVICILEIDPWTKLPGW